MVDRTTQGSKPDPDPTVLTTAALQREVAAIEKLFDQRVNSIERAVAVAHENLVRVPTEVEKAVGHLSELTDEKLRTVAERFNGIQTQFSERDTRVDKSATESKEALAAALQAAKELVGNQNASFVASIAKSDASTEKQFDALRLTITTASAATDKTIGDLKERLTLLEGLDRGKSAAVIEQRDSGNAIANWGGLIAGSILALAAIMSFFFSRVSVH